MAISSPLINLGTGKPVKAYTPLHLNRDASRRGIQQSNVDSFREFSQAKVQRSSPSVDELSQKAGELFRMVQSGQKVDLKV